MPTITRGLIGISNAVTAYGAHAATAIIVGVLVFQRLFQRARFRVAVQRLCMRAPLVGTLMVERGAGDFARTLAVLLDSGVNLVEGLTIVAQTSSLIPFKDVLSRCASTVREGVSLSKALAAHKIVPPLLTYLVANGEVSGDLPKMLDTAADTFETKTAHALTVIAGLLEPAMILAMGAIVLFIVVAILLPIFDMNQLV